MVSTKLGSSVKVMITTPNNTLFDPTNYTRTHRYPLALTSKGVYTPVGTEAAVVCSAGGGVSVVSGGADPLRGGVSLRDAP